MLGLFYALMAGQGAKIELIVTHHTAGAAGEINYVRI